MALIHRTTLTPTKLELLAEWLPRQPWFEGTLEAAGARLRRIGGFRLDDPTGEVGIEIMVVGSAVEGGGEAAHLVPMTYRGAELAGAAEGLIGTCEHGVLGKRWIYDGLYDQVFVAQLFALMRGEVQAQEQSVSDTVDPTVDGSLPPGEPVELEEVFTYGSGTEVRLHPAPRMLQVNRRLAEGPAPHGVRGYVTGQWAAGGEGGEEKVRGVFFTVR
ncbi:1,4-alpha-glucan branching protein [Streptomyces polyrhachis]|uniref:1,4-alpha-glucan branching protein n=1 Tax=Streptomyces polyrhachis TaxID=1282885 RepID=A0ABW2GQG8_9ACTN